MALCIQSTYAKVSPILSKAEECCEYWWGGSLLPQFLEEIDISLPENYLF